MAAVKVSPKFQIVIPEEVRRAMGLKPGELLEVIPEGDHIHLIRIPKIRDLKGSLRGTRKSFTRYKKHRF